MLRASKNNQQEAGRTIVGTRLANEVESGAAQAGAFKALPKLFYLHRLLPGGHHQRLGWHRSAGEPTRTDAIAALRPRVRSSGRYRIRYESYSGRIGGGWPAHGTSRKGAGCACFLPWSLVSQGRRAVASRVDGRNFVYLRLAQAHYSVTSCVAVVGLRAPT